MKNLLKRFYDRRGSGGRTAGPTTPGLASAASSIASSRLDDSYDDSNGSGSTRQSLDSLCTPSLVATASGGSSRGAARGASPYGQPRFAYSTPAVVMNSGSNDSSRNTSRSSRSDECMLTSSRSHSSTQAPVQQNAGTHGIEPPAAPGVGKVRRRNSIRSRLLQSSGLSKKSPPVTDTPQATDKESRLRASASYLDLSSQAGSRLPRSVSCQLLQVTSIPAASDSTENTSTATSDSLAARRKQHKSGHLSLLRPASDRRAFLAEDGPGQQQQQQQRRLRFMHQRHSSCNLPVIEDRQDEDGAAVLTLTLEATAVAGSCQLPEKSALPAAAGSAAAAGAAVSGAVSAAGASCETPQPQLAQQQMKNNEDAETSLTNNSDNDDESDFLDDLSDSVSVTSSLEIVTSAVVHVSVTRVAAAEATLVYCCTARAHLDDQHEIYPVRSMIIESPVKPAQQDRLQQARRRSISVCDSPQAAAKKPGKALSGGPVAALKKWHSYTDFKALFATSSSKQQGETVSVLLASGEPIVSSNRRAETTVGSVCDVGGDDGKNNKNYINSAVTSSFQYSAATAAQAPSPSGHPVFINTQIPPSSFPSISLGDRALLYKSLPSLPHSASTPDLKEMSTPSASSTQLLHQHAPWLAALVEEETSFSPVLSSPTTNFSRGSLGRATPSPPPHSPHSPQRHPRHPRQQQQQQPGAVALAITTSHTVPYSHSSADDLATLPTPNAAFQQTAHTPLGTPVRPHSFNFSPTSSSSPSYSLSSAHAGPASACSSPSLRPAGTPSSPGTPALTKKKKKQRRGAPRETIALVSDHSSSTTSMASLVPPPHHHNLHHNLHPASAAATPTALWTPPSDHGGDHNDSSSSDSGIHVEFQRLERVLHLRPLSYCGPATSPHHAAHSRSATPPAERRHSVVCAGDEEDCADIYFHDESPNWSFSTNDTTECALARTGAGPTVVAAAPPSPPHEPHTVNASPKFGSRLSPKALIRRVTTSDSSNSESSERSPKPPGGRLFSRSSSSSLASLASMPSSLRSQSSGVSSSSTKAAAAAKSKKLAHRISLSAVKTSARGALSPTPQRRGQSASSTPTTAYPPLGRAMSFSPTTATAAGRQKASHMESLDTNTSSILSYYGAAEYFEPNSGAPSPTPSMTSSAASTLSSFFSLRKRNQNNAHQHTTTPITPAFDASHAAAAASSSPLTPTPKQFRSTSDPLPLSRPCIPAAKAARDDDDDDDDNSPSSQKPRIAVLTSRYGLIRHPQPGHGAFDDADAWTNYYLARDEDQSCDELDYWEDYEDGSVARTLGTVIYV